jgi:thiamine kinase-like enzyme
MGWGDLGRLRSDLAKTFDSIGQSVPPAFWEEYDALTERIENAALFRAFVHNDSCPDNTILERDRVRLIDWERGGFHACLIDAAYARLGMPHCWLAQKLPEQVVSDTERRYRLRLAKMIPEVLDDALFGQRMTEACAYWLISNGTWRNLGDDFQWGASTWHQRVVTRLEQFARTTREFSHLHEMGRTAQETLRRLHTRWNVEPMPLYHAFRR